MNIQVRLSLFLEKPTSNIIDDIQTRFKKFSFLSMTKME